MKICTCFIVSNLLLAGVNLLVAEAQITVSSVCCLLAAKYSCFLFASCNGLTNHFDCFYLTSCLATFVVHSV